jgi:hypothetical protein
MAREYEGGVESQKNNSWGGWMVDGIKTNDAFE